jgi:hypothetical protein
MLTGTCTLKGPTKRTQHALLPSAVQTPGGDAKAQAGIAAVHVQARCPLCRYWLIPQYGPGEPHFACLCTQAKKEKSHAKAQRSTDTAAA